MKNLLKLALLNSLLVHGIYAQCIGNDYEQENLLSYSIIEDVTIEGFKSRVKSKGIMPLTQNIDIKDGYDDSKVFYYICVDKGLLERVEGEKDYKSINYIAPNVSSAQKAKIDFKIGDGYGHSYYKSLNINIEPISNEKDISNWKEILNGRYSDIIYKNGKFITVGAKGNIAISTDGTNWQTIEYSQKDKIGDLVAVTYGNGKWVAVGGTSKKGVTVVSTNGTDWNVVNSYTTSKITDVYFANNLFVKVGAKSLKSYSTDGESWHGGYFGIIIDGASADFTSVTYDRVHSKWIAVGTARGDLIYTSTDGKKWNENSFKLSGISLNDIDSYNGKTIAVAYKSSSPRGGIVLTSNDGGLTWNSKQVVNNNPIVSINHTSIGWFGSVGNGDILFSNNGDSWSNQKTNRTQYSTSFVYADALNKLIASGHTWNIYEAQPKDSLIEFSINLTVHEGGKVLYNSGSCKNGSSCSPILANKNDSVILTAEPYNGYKFSKWLGDCSGDGECVLNINSNKRVEAFFEKITLDTDNDGIPNDKDLDDDNDGISDIDEVANGLNPLDPTDATADNDGDGYTNKEEIASGTDINNANSKPISNVVKSVTIRKGFGLYGINSSMSLTELIEKIGKDNLLSINSSTETYQLKYIKDGLEFLNDFTKLEPFKAVWIEVADDVTISYNEMSYIDKEITLESGKWYLLNPIKDMSLDEIKAQVGENNIEVIQGLVTTYQQKYIDNGTSFLNDFTGFVEPKGYWVKLKESATLGF